MKCNISITEQKVIYKFEEKSFEYSLTDASINVSDLVIYLSDLNEIVEVGNYDEYKKDFEEYTKNHIDKKHIINFINKIINCYNNAFKSVYG